jgi:hypothetical protein
METTAQGNARKAKHWVLTINNYDSRDISRFEDLKEFAQYFIYGKEVGENGTAHLQCYMVGNKQLTVPFLLRLWPRHYREVAKGTPEQASNYCKKEGDYVEWGILPSPKYQAGAKATSEKWAQIRDDAKIGNFDSISPKIFITHYRSLKQIHYDYAPPVDDLLDVCGEWIYGPPGIGKSHKARAMNPLIYNKMANKWWDNYNNEPAILIDDFDKTHSCLGYHLKIWADRYKFRAEMKNFSKVIRPAKIVITSNYSIDEIFDHCEVLREAIKRRFKVSHMVQLATPQKRGNTNIYHSAPIKKQRFCLKKTNSIPIPLINISSSESGSGTEEVTTDTEIDEK